VGTNGPYEIAFDSIQPRKDQCQNLLVPVCVSSSHIAFGSIRMEPVFMILGQSAATAAVQAIDNQQPVQDVDYAVLRARLLDDAQVLDIPAAAKPPTSLHSDKLPGVTVDETQAKFEGDWSTSSSLGPFVDFGYRHDGNSNKGQMSATFSTQLDAGMYEVRLYYPPNSNRATNVPVTVRHAGGQQLILVNQKRADGEPPHYAELGVFAFDGKSPAAVEIGNADTDGHVIADAVQFLPKE
jgi:hypothetical protein